MKKNVTGKVMKNINCRVTLSLNLKSVHGGQVIYLLGFLKLSMCLTWD